MKIKLSKIFRINVSFENGLFLNLDYRLGEIYRKMVRSQLKIYENLDDYIGDYMVKSDVQLDNFKKIFSYFCYLYVLVILIFVLNHIYGYRRVIKKLLKKMVQKLQKHFYIYIAIVISMISKYLNDSADWNIIKSN